MRVFIGSTFRDLQDHRKAILEALTELSVQIEAMELWYARPEDPLSVCLQRVDGSDIYVCILGHRYGAARRFKSFTQREYERAQSSKKDCLVFIMNPDYPVPGRMVDTGLSAWRLQRLKKHLRQMHYVADFGSPGDLAHKVVESVRDLMARRHDRQAESLDLREFWRSLESAWQQVEPPELRIPFDAEDDPLILLEKMEAELHGISFFHDAMERSHERMADDLRDLLTRIGVDPTKLKQVPYFENPFELRDAESLMLFPNRIFHMQALIAHARVSILEKGLVDRTDSSEELTRAKKQLTDALSRIQID